MAIGVEGVVHSTSACIMCEGRDWSSVRQAGDIHRPNSGRIYKLEKCRSCGQTMQNPLPDRSALSEAYSIDYGPYQAAWREDGWRLWKVLRAWTMSRRIAHLNRHADGHELLEVGSGGGDFLVAAQRAGWNVRAVEYSEEMVEAVREHLGFDVRVGDLQPGIWPHGEFDTVVLWAVLEHLPEPLEALRTAADYLRPGGTVLLTIPTRDAAERGKFFGEHWALLDLPRHLHFFHRSTLATLCERAGLTLVDYRTPLIETAWCYLASSVRYANRSGSRPLRLARLALLGSAVMFMLPYLALVSSRGRGTEAFAVAVKPKT